MDITYDQMYKLLSNSSNYHYKKWLDTNDDFHKEKYHHYEELLNQLSEMVPTVKWVLSH